MAQDVLTHIAASITEFRTGSTRLLELGGHPAPATEKDWLKFSLNQSLRNRGMGKPLPWTPAAPEPAQQ